MHEKGRPDAEIRHEKAEMMGEFYRMLCSFLGEPPRSFDLRTADARRRFPSRRGDNAARILP
jgi:bleomycin hydrolase